MNVGQKHWEERLCGATVVFLSSLVQLQGNLMHQYNTKLCVCVQVRLNFLAWDEDVKVKMSVINMINESQDGVNEYYS